MFFSKAADAQIVAKSQPLEALRGLAAFTVLLGHVLLGFFPQMIGIIPGKWSQSEALTGQIWFGLINGTAAVTLFFVLSAYVLTRRFMLTGDPKLIVRASLKRWPRLAGPVVVVCLFSSALFTFGAYRYEQAGVITGSTWLAKFCNGLVDGFAPHASGAFHQGALLTFFRGDYSYDSSIWTMRYEMVGSFVAFGAALLVAEVHPGHKPLRFTLLALIALLAYYASPFYVAFPAGLALAGALDSRPGKLPGWAVLILTALAVYLLGYTGADRGAFALVAHVAGPNPTLVHVSAAVILIATLERASPRARARLSGQIAASLGRLSFPLYLIHIPVLASAGCATLLWARSWTMSPLANVLAALVTILGAVVAALPLLVFNEWWIRFVNRFADWLMRPAARPAHGEEPVMLTPVTAET